MNTMRIQKWQDGEIVKTLKGEYQYIKDGYKSPLYTTIAQLVKDESNQTTKRSNSTAKPKKGAKKVEQSTETATNEAQEQDD